MTLNPKAADSSAIAPEVTVIIVTYNSAEQIEACLTSAIHEAEDFNQEITVVDNDSQDGTVEIIKSKFPTVRLFDTKQNLGFAKACNYAVRHCSSPYILLLNPDTIVLDNAVGKVLRFAKEHPQYGFYGGRTLKEDGKTLEPSSCWGQPSVWSLFLFATGLSTLFKHRNFFDPEAIGSWKRDTVREVGVITGCFLLANKMAWDKISGFDEHYWLYGEDTDLAMRARAAGYKPVIYPEAVVIHEVGQSSTSAQKMIWLYRGKVSIIKRHWNGLARAAALILLKSGIILRATVFTLAGKKESHWVVGWKKRHSWHNGHPD